MSKQVFPCRVNELFSSRIRHRLSLNGIWHFTADQLRRLTVKQASQKALNLKLKVPGCWEAQGVGGPGLLTRTPYSTNWFKGTYRGLGWYRKQFDYNALLPDNRIWLKMGVIHGNATIYLNGCLIGKLSRTLGAYRFDITEACKPIGNMLLVVADNDLDSSGGAGDALGVMGGLTQGVEIEQTASTWITSARVTGDVKRQAAVGQIKILNTDFHKSNEAKYKIRLTAFLNTSRNKKRNIDLDFQPTTKGGTVDLPFALPIPHAALWSPETPALYTLTVQLLCNNTVIDEYTTRFGFRSLSVRGARIYLNNKPFFMAGCGTMTHTPKTVCPTTDRTALRREFRRMKAYGFVYMRYHTETPYDELFDAADEVGLLIQPENRPFQGQNNEPVQAGGEIEFNAEMARETDAETSWHIRETAMINEHFGNHPSLAVYCMGNEYYDNKLTTRRKWHKAVKVMDPTRLAISADGQRHYHAGADDYVAGFLNDPKTLRKTPVVLHEFVSSPTLPDAREAKHFKDGMLVPESLRRYLAWARRNGIGRDRLRKLSVASHKLQENHLKYGIEKARAIPGIQGYGIWRYHDFWQFPTRIGIVTVHGADKDRQPADLRAYNNQTVLIANLARDNMEINGMPTGRHLEVYGSHQVESVCRCGESIALTLYLSHYGAETVRNGWLNWKVVCGATVLAQGRLRAPECRSGATTRCGIVQWRMPDKNTPCEVCLKVELDSSTAKVANTWSLWAFPREMPAKGRDLACYGLADTYFPLDTAIIRRINDARDLCGLDKNTIVITDSLCHGGIKAFLAKGGRVLLVSARDFPSQAIVAHPGWWSAGPHRFTGAVLEKHPVFKDWPGSGFADWPFYRFFMSKEACEFPEKLNGKFMPTTVVPVFERRPFAHDAIAYGVRGVQEGWTSPIQHFQFGWMPYLFEMRVGSGQVFACMLRLRNDPLVGNWLAQSILKYMRSAAFQPKARADWRQVCPSHARDVAVNCPVYYRRVGEADEVLMHGLRKGNGYRLASLLAPHKHCATLSLGRYCPAQYPKAIFLDLCHQWRIGKVLVKNIAGGNVRNVRVSIGKDQNSWTVLGTQCFPAEQSVALSFKGLGSEARLVRIECLDSYPYGKGTPQKLLLGKVTVLSLAK